MCTYFGVSEFFARSNPPWAENNSTNLSQADADPLQRIGTVYLTVLGYILLLSIHVYAIPSPPEIVSVSTTNPSPELVVDSTPLIIANITTIVYQTSFTVTWTTNRPADAQLWCRRISEWYKNPFKVDELSQLHRVDVTGLKPGVIYYYKIYSTDVNGFTATSLEIQLITEPNSIQKSIDKNGGTILLSDELGDNQIYVTVPKNTFPRVQTVKIKQKNPYDFTARAINQSVEFKSMVPLSVYEFTGKENVPLNKPVLVSLTYPIDSEGYVNINGLKFVPTELRVFWYDITNSQWRYLGGIIDTKKCTVTVKIQNLLLLALFPIDEEQITADTFRPIERIFTPNNDGMNDTIHFNGIHNLTYANTTRPEQGGVKIYNSIGKHINELRNTDTWDGKDKSGKLVDSGVYLYKFTFYRTTVTGSVLVIR